MATPTSGFAARGRQILFLKRDFLRKGLTHWDGS